MTCDGTGVAASSTTATMAASALVTTPSLMVDQGGAAGIATIEAVGYVRGRSASCTGATWREQCDVMSTCLRCTTVVLTVVPLVGPGAEALAVLTPELVDRFPICLVNARTQSRGFIGTSNTEIQQKSEILERWPIRPFRSSTGRIRCLLFRDHAHGTAAARPRPVCGAGGP